MYWIPARERARTGALFMMAGPVAVIVGGPVSEALLGLDGALWTRGMAMAVPDRRSPGRRPGVVDTRRPDRLAGRRDVADARRARWLRTDHGRRAGDPAVRRSHEAGDKSRERSSVDPERGPFHSKDDWYRVKRTDVLLRIIASMFFATVTPSRKPCCAVGG